MEEKEKIQEEKREEIISENNIENEKENSDEKNEKDEVLKEEKTEEFKNEKLTPLKIIKMASFLLPLLIVIFSIIYYIITKNTVSMWVLVASALLIVIALIFNGIKKD